jgi:hypothetical protein
VPLFAGSLLYEATVSRWRATPNLPQLVFAASNDDAYVSTSGVIGWAKRQPRAIGVQCPNARHWMDHEPVIYGGEEVKSEAAKFAASVVAGRSYAYRGRICRQFR